MEYIFSIDYGIGVYLDDVDSMELVDPYLKFISREQPRVLRAITEMAEQSCLTIVDYLGDSESREPLIYSWIAESMVEEFGSISFSHIEGSEHSALLYSPKYPWEMNSAENEITREEVINMFSAFGSKLGLNWSASDIEVRHYI